MARAALSSLHDFFMRTTLPIILTDKELAESGPPRGWICVERNPKCHTTTWRIVNDPRASWRDDKVTKTRQQQEKS